MNMIKVAPDSIADFPRATKLISIPMNDVTLRDVSTERPPIRPGEAGMLSSGEAIYRVGRCDVCSHE